MTDSTRRKRLFWKAAAVTVLLIAVAAVFGNRLYRTIQTPQWTALAEAEEKAVRELGLIQVMNVERFVGDQVYTVINATYGPQDKPEPIIAWMWDGGYHIERQEDGLSSDEIKTAALQENPAKDLLRITPGVLYGEYVWEVFYSLREEGGTRKYYDYYRFRDGTKLETYRLALERD